MKKKNIVGLIMGIGIAFGFLTGCFNDGIEGRAENPNQSASSEEIERLPEDQKESELDKMLAEHRKYRKENKYEQNGSLVSIGMSNTNIPDKANNKPSFESKELEDIFEVINKYLKEEKGMKEDKNGEIEEANISEAIDPRINAIYDEDDKGVAKGFKNENIFVGEYEDKDGSYKYLVLVRNSNGDKWKIIHDGTSYKK